MKRRAFFSILIAAAMLLSGCVFEGAELSAMLTPPAMTSGREALSRAIKSAIGESYELVGPKEGDYRTGIISVELTGDEEKEAVCFYRTDRLGLLVMQSEGESWKLLAKAESDASSVGRVAFGDLDGDGLSEIVVGWQYLTNTDGSYEVYKFSKGEAVSCYVGLYSRFLILEGKPDRLVVMTRNSATKSVTASLVGQLEDQIGVVNTVVMNERAMDYLAINAGKTSNGLPAVYIDELTENGQCMTEVLAINTEGFLTNELLMQMDNSTLRYSAVTCRDTDQDGIFEIPTEYPLPSYIRNGVQENLYMTRWVTFDGKSLKAQGRSFVDTTEKFYLDIPGEWQDKITVERGASGDRAFLFKRMDGELLFTVRIHGLSEYSENTEGRMGWRKLHSNSDYVYTVFCEPDNSLRIGYSRVYGLFNVIN